MRKKLSVLVPSYNFGDYIIDCVDSIYKQKTNFEFDVIVRDDNSTDDTIQKLQMLKYKYPSLIILDGSINLGPFRNIKKLYENTDSEYIGYLDGDDMYGNEDNLQKQIDFLDSNPTHVMCFTGCKYLMEDGKIYPDDERVICSVKDLITTNDLLEKNYVGFAKVFRNIPNILKEEYSHLPYVDWTIAYELSKYGPIKYLDIFGGYYRISDNGIFSKISEEEKIKGFNLVKNFLHEDNMKSTTKKITIIDSFVTNNSVLIKLRETIRKLKSHNNKILLVSNSYIPTDVIQSVDYFLYNKENKLFKENYTDIGLVDLWKSFSQITIHEINEEFQKHGLSVLCNLFNSLDLAKSLGYTHFQRIEVDDLYSDYGLNYMNSVEELCKSNGKKSLFYLNEGKDASFHYFFSEIDFFLKTFPRIRDEQSFINYLKQNNFGMSFRSVEVFIYENLKKTNLDEVFVKDGQEEIYRDFEGTVWNTESSQATISEKYEGCTTKIYRVQNSTNIGVVSYNYNNYPIQRKIVVKLHNKEETIYHKLDYFDAWAYNIFDSSVESIKVYDLVSDKFLYDLQNKNVEDFIELK